jgi:hypothetical protein
MQVSVKAEDGQVLRVLLLRQCPLPIKAEGKLKLVWVKWFGF